MLLGVASPSIWLDCSLASPFVRIFDLASRKQNSRKGNFFAASSAGEAEDCLSAEEVLFLKNTSEAKSNIWTLRDSNPQPLGCKPSALTN